MSSSRKTASGWEAKSDSYIRDIAVGKSSDPQAAWSELLRRHGQGVCRAIEAVLLRCGRITDYASVEDLVESSWLKVTKDQYRKLSQWDPDCGTSLGTYLATIGMWEALSWCRYKARRKEVIIDLRNVRVSARLIDARLTPEQAAWLSEAEALIQDWELRLQALGEGLVKRPLVGFGESQQFVSKLLIDLKCQVLRIL
jgi:DNA-directed RNA polymerase specialized sigma24 family protein